MQLLWFSAFSVVAVVAHSLLSEVGVVSAAVAAAGVGDVASGADVASDTAVAAALAVAWKPLNLYSQRGKFLTQIPEYELILGILVGFPQPSTILSRGQNFGTRSKCFHERREPKKLSGFEQSGVLSRLWVGGRKSKYLQLQKKYMLIYGRVTTKCSGKGSFTINVRRTFRCSRFF